MEDKHKETVTEEKLGKWEGFPQVGDKGKNKTPAAEIGKSSHPGTPHQPPHLTQVPTVLSPSLFVSDWERFLGKGWPALP